MPKVQEMNSRLHRQLNTVSNEQLNKEHKRIDALLYGNKISSNTADKMRETIANRLSYGIM